MTCTACSITQTPAAYAAQTHDQQTGIGFATLHLQEQRCVTRQQLHKDNQHGGTTAAATFCIGFAAQATVKLTVRSNSTFADPNPQAAYLMSLQSTAANTTSTSSRTAFVTHRACQLAACFPRQQFAAPIPRKKQAWSPMMMLFPSLPKCAQLSVIDACFDCLSLTLSQMQQPRYLQRSHSTQPKYGCCCGVTATAITIHKHMSRM